jgi:hypothetical protein
VATRKQPKVSTAPGLTEAGKLFMHTWQAEYPETPPIGHHFKRKLNKRWMRIHSLPEAQRYPNNTADSAILLKRQNAIIDYLVPQGTAVQWVWTRIDPDCHLFWSFDLTELGTLHSVDDEADYALWHMHDKWRSGENDVFLSMVADDAVRAFIIAPNCLIAPYDGGVDVILPTPHEAHAFKRKFAEWVSPRADGL